jgi:hypothetical protein
MSDATSASATLAKVDPDPKHFTIDAPAPQSDFERVVYTAEGDVRYLHGRVLFGKYALGPILIP